MSFEEKQRSIGKIVAASADAPSPAVSSQGSYVYYQVKNGDTVWEIAKKFPGVTEQDILRLNNLTGSEKIMPGQQLKIQAK